SMFALNLSLFVSGTLLRVSLAQTRQYYFVNTTLNWTDAQSLCRRDYADLATAESTADVEAVVRSAADYTGEYLTMHTPLRRACLAWIGLYDDLVNSWKWSLNDSSFYGDGEQTFRNCTSLFRNWAFGQPNHGGEECMATHFNESGKWHDQDCSLSYPFICYKPILFHLS
uniref:C-type lectin domain-containing protein n=1 Tax=Poecilia mexicana TaxID=48701 RepID=A0A3B3Z163_9TELE